MVPSLPYSLDTSSIRIEVDIRDERAVVRLSGVLDQVSANSADAAFEFVRRSKHVVLDLSSLQYLDRAGLAPIIRLRTIIEARGGKVEIVGASGVVATVIRLSMGSGSQSPWEAEGAGLFRSAAQLDPPA
ncbi:MAG TPA: STAS domain-containing protein [Acidimicrobiales bacterium]|nr:STAS domain-containing protein [Acidimicrobiales bacterium]